MIREVVVKYRRSEVPLEKGAKYSNSREIYEAFKDLILERVEVFRVIFLNAKNEMLFFEDVSRGSLSTSVVHPREVFSTAVRIQAAALIMLHNHPSGDAAPSREDRECTRRLVSAGKIQGIKVLDHIIIGDPDYFSFADAGLLAGEE